MNNWQDEVLAESNRQRILQAVEQIRLEKLVRKSRVFRPRLFAQSMVNSGNWMISAGKQLLERYESRLEVGYE